MMMLLALPPARGTGRFAAGDIRGPCRDRLQLEHRAETQAQQARPPYAENVAPGVMPSCGSHRSFPACPGTMMIVSLLVWGLVGREGVRVPPLNSTVTLGIP